jgi:AraC-like DNA-binding protein
MTRGGGVHRALSICNAPLIQPKPLRHPEMFLFRIKTCRQARPHSKHTRFRFRNKFGMTRGGGVHRALSICNAPLIQPKPLPHPEMFLFRIKTCRQARPHRKHTRFRFRNKFGMTRGGVCIALCRSATPR